jgi:hypothetical protein
MTENTENTEDTTEEVKTPQSFEELGEQVEILKTLPPMVAPQDMSISQSVNFTLVFDLVIDKQSKLFAKSEEKDQQGRAFLFAEIVETEANLFRELAKNSKKFDEWGKGVTAPALFQAFGALMNFYTEQLGKSTASKQQSKPTE